MKKILGLCVISFIIGFSIPLIKANASNPNEYYVVIKVKETGNTIALSDKFIGYEKCVNSADYQIHTLVSKESNVDIQCSTTPTYKL